MAKTEFGLPGRASFRNRTMFVVRNAMVEIEFRPTGRASFQYTPMIAAANARKGRGVLSDLNQTKITRFEGSLGAIAHAQFPQDVGHMVFHCAFCNIKLAADFFITGTVGHEGQDL